MINLVAYMQIGNAWIDDATNTQGLYDYLWNHATHSDETHAKINKFCNFSETIPSKECDQYCNKAWEEAGNIDIYNIYAPVCLKSGNSKAHILHSVCPSLYSSTLNSQTSESMTLYFVYIFSGRGF